MATNREREPRDLTFQKFVNAPEGLAPVQHQADTDTSQFVGGEFTVGKPAQQIGPTDAEAWANLGVQIAGLGEATTKVLHARANKQEREDQDETESKINAFILTESNPEKRKEFIQKAIDDTPAYIDNTSWKKTTLTKYQSSFLGDRSADEYAQDKILGFNTEWLKEGKRTDNQEYKLALEEKFGSDLTIANSPFFKGSLNQVNGIINNTRYAAAREGYISTVTSLLTIPDKVNLHNLDTGSQAFFKGQPEQLGMILGIQALGEDASVAQQREVVWGIIREQGKGFEEQIQKDPDIRARITLEVNKGVDKIRVRLGQEVAALNHKSQQDSFNNAKGQGAVSADATMNLLVTGVSVSGSQQTELNLAVLTLDQYSPEIINANNHPAFRGKDLSTLSVMDREEAMDAWFIEGFSKVEQGQTKSRWEALGIFKDRGGNTNTTPAQYLEQIKNTKEYRDRQTAFFGGIDKNQKATYEREQTQMILVPAGVKSDDIYNKSTASLSLTLDLPKIAHADLSVGALRGKSFEDFVNSIEEPKEKELFIKRYPAGSTQGSWAREYWDKYQANIRALDVTVAQRNAVNSQREDSVRINSINSDVDQNTAIRAFINKVSTGPDATKIISYLLAKTPGTPGVSYPTQDSVEKAYNQLISERIQLFKSNIPFPELYKEPIQLFNANTEDTWSGFMKTLEPPPKTKGGGGGSGSGGSSKQNTTESFVVALDDAGTSYAHASNSSNMAAAFIDNVLDPGSTIVTPSTQRFKESLNNAYGELGAPPLNSEMNEEEKKTFLLSTRIRPNTDFFNIAGRHLDASEEYFTRTGGRATLNQAGANLYAINKAYTTVALSSAVASDLTEVYDGFSVILNKLADNPENLKEFLLDSGSEGKMIQLFATVAAFSKLDIERIPDGDKRREIEKMMPLIKDLAMFNPLAGAFNYENRLESTILDLEVAMTKKLVEANNPNGQISIPNFAEIRIDGEPARGLFGRVESSTMMNASNAPQVIMRILSDRTSTGASYAFLGADAHTKSPEELKERAQRADAVISSGVPYGIPEINDTTSDYPITTEAGTTRLWKDLAQGEKLLVRAMAAVYGTLPGSDYINKYTTTKGDPLLFKTIRAMVLAATSDGDNKQMTLMVHQNTASKNLSNQNREIEPIIEYVEGSPVITYKLAERDYPPAIKEDLAKFSSPHKPTDGVREFIVTPTGRLTAVDVFTGMPSSISIWPGLGSENTPPPLEQAFATILPPTSKFSARLKTVLLDNSDASLNYLYNAFKIPKEGRNLDLTEKGSSALSKLSEALNRSPQWSGAAADNMIRSLAENRFTIDSNENSLFLVVDTIDGTGGPAEIRIDLSALGQVPYVRAMGVHYSNHEAAQLYHVLDRLEQYKKQSQRQRPPLTGSVGLSDTDFVVDNEIP